MGKASKIDQHISLIGSFFPANHRAAISLTFEEGNQKRGGGISRSPTKKRASLALAHPTSGSVQTSSRGVANPVHLEPPKAQPVSTLGKLLIQGCTKR